MMDNNQLDRIRKLLAKAEGDGVTPAEAEALTVKAAELMAKYGIDRALLAAQRPGSDRPCDRKIEIANPWARAKAHLLYNLATSLRCQAIRLPDRTRSGEVMHVFGFESDLERLDVLFTSLLLQMFSGLRFAGVPSWLSGRQAMAWRRSWLIGYSETVATRVSEAERKVQQKTEDSTAPGTALVLADRSLVVQNAFRKAYPNIRQSRMTCGYSGYRQGSAAGQRADIGGTRIGPRAAGALSR